MESIPPHPYTAFRAAIENLDMLEFGRVFPLDDSVLEHLMEEIFDIYAIDDALRIKEHGSYWGPETHDETCARLCLMDAFLSNRYLDGYVGKHEPRQKCPRKSSCVRTLFQFRKNVYEHYNNGGCNGYYTMPPVPVEGLEDVYIKSESRPCDTQLMVESDPSILDRGLTAAVRYCLDAKPYVRDGDEPTRTYADEVREYNEERKQKRLCKKLKQMTVCV